MDKLKNVTDPDEILNLIEGYVWSARRSRAKGKTALVTVGYIGSMVKRYKELVK